MEQENKLTDNKKIIDLSEEVVCKIEFNPKNDMFGLFSSLNTGSNTDIFLENTDNVNLSKENTDTNSQYDNKIDLKNIKTMTMDEVNEALEQDNSINDLITQRPSSTIYQKSNNMRKQVKSQGSKLKNNNNKNQNKDVLETDKSNTDSHFTHSVIGISEGNTVFDGISLGNTNCFNVGEYQDNQETKKNICHSNLGQTDDKIVYKFKNCKVYFCQCKKN